MIKIRKYLPLLVISLLILIAGARVWYTANSEKEDLKIKLSLIRQFGGPDDSKEGMLGLISSFTLDQYQNLYVLDNAFKVIRKFSKDGRFIRNFGLGAGRGPGELNSPHNICVDSMGNVYVIDKSNLNITTFDSSSKFVNSVKVPFLPAQIIALSPMKVDVTGFLSFYKGNIVQRYDLLREDSNIPVKTYCQRLTGASFNLAQQAGNSGRLIQSPKGDIYFSFFYPYEIHKYSPDGQLLMKIYGNRQLVAPKTDPKTGIVLSPAGIKEFVILPNEILLALVSETRDKMEVQYFDFYNGKNGKFLGSVPCKKLGLEHIRFLRTDIAGNIYIDLLEPYPHIKKYKLEMEFE